jgi:hypothetical protein
MLGFPMLLGQFVGLCTVIALTNNPFVRVSVALYQQAKNGQEKKEDNKK